MTDITEVPRTRHQIKLAAKRHYGRQGVRCCSRVAVVEILGLHLSGASHASAMTRCPALAALSPADAERARSISGHAGAHRARIAERLAKYIHNPLPHDAQTVTAILTAGVAELELGGHNWAPALIVSAYVSQTRDRGFEGLSRLVNAVLRRISEEEEAKRADAAS